MRINNEVEYLIVDKSLLGIVNRAIGYALEYEKATNWKRKLGITDEVGEILACYKFELRLAADSCSKGYDALDKNALKVQIKTRRSESEKLPKKSGRTGSFSKHKFDYALLVLLDRNYKLCEVWKADYKKLNPLIERQKRRNPNLASFKRIGERIFKI